MNLKGVLITYNLKDFKSLKDVKTPEELLKNE